MKKLVIIGNTSNAKLAHYYFQSDSDYQVVGFAVHKKYIEKLSFCDLPVIELEKLVENYPPQEYDAFVAIGYSGMNSIREGLYQEIKQKGYTLPNYVSSHCTFLTNEEIGDNNLILENNVIQPFVKIGSNNVLWSGNHIGHDVEIMNNCFITSHVVIAGFVTIENNCFFGVNSTIRDGIKIKSFTLIGAGSVIMKSTRAKSVFLAPKPIKFDKLSTDINI